MTVKSIIETDNFKRLLKNLDNSYKLRVERLINKIAENPEIGKPMRYTRKGTREVYVSPFRLSYAYIKSEDKIVLLDLYHKDEQ